MHVDTGSFIEAVLEPLRASPFTLPKDKMAASEVVDSVSRKCCNFAVTPW
jgi:hypothetical protein